MVDENVKGLAQGCLLFVVGIFVISMAVAGLVFAIALFGS